MVSNICRKALLLLAVLSCSCSKIEQESLILRIDGEDYKAGLGAQVHSFSDINDDGFPEIIAASPYGRSANIGVFCGRTGESIYQVEQNRESYLLRYFAVVRDLNGDEIQDIVSPDTWAGRGLWFFSGKDGTPLFKAEEKTVSASFEEPRVVVVPDKNNDKYHDVALQQGNRILLISGCDGRTLDKIGPLVESNDYVRYDCMPDVDGDGFDDIVAFSDETKRLDNARFASRNQMWYISSGNWEIVEGPVDFPLNQVPRRYTFADVNADGVLDILCCHVGGGRPAGSVLLAVSGKDGSELWRVNGADVQKGAVVKRVDADTGKTGLLYSDVQFGASICIIPDIDGDGIPDVATGHPTLFNEQSRTNGCVYVFSGKNGKILHILRSPDENTRIGKSIAAFADADFDGKADLLAGAQSAAVNGKEKVGSVLVLRL